MRLLEIGAFSLIAGVISILIAAAVLRTLPEDYFLTGHNHTKWRVLKNIAGGLLIIVGIVMSVPGVPGQGLLTILSGVILSDFPKKIELERWLMRRRAVFRGANAIRRRFGKPPFLEPSNEAVLR